MAVRIQQGVFSSTESTECNSQKKAHKKSAWSRFASKLSCLKRPKVSKGSKNHKTANEEVIVFMNEPLQNEQFLFPNNFIHTSKYTIWSFLPLGLFYQFMNVSNLFFLLHMTISLIPGVSPVTPITSVLPLIFVLTVALSKEGVEDILRHQSDKRVNSLQIEVLRDGQMMLVPSFSLLPGDIVKISNDNEITADMILLSSSLDGGQVFIDTCNLDGETNLKTRKALEATWNLNNVEEFSKTNAVLHTTQPNSGLLSWMGVLSMNGKEYSMSLEQFLYRGCILKNTEWAWGMVVYTGVNTKLFKNLKKKPFKRSSLTYKMNVLISIVFVAHNICLILLSGLAYWWRMTQGQHWYVAYFVYRDKLSKFMLYHYMTYFALLSYLIPISLFVTIDLCKVVQAYWMRADPEMRVRIQGKWKGCMTNTSNLNEQLALVKFIFTDKTGTLTENVMKFNSGDALGVSITLDNLKDLTNTLAPDDKNYEAVVEYFLALALCNTIHIFTSEADPDQITYGGPSTDEKALVEAAAEAGFVMVQRNTQSITLKIGHEERVFNILATLEFTPERKMMSIIVEDSATGKITLFSKGADSFVKGQLSSEVTVQGDLSKAEVALSNASSIGLRTLLVCARDLSRSDFDSWNKKFKEAGKKLQDRSRAVDKVCLEIEQDLRLVGVTAIEDRLQDEVPETLSFFLEAGVVIWMLTGDKRETAVSIGATSTLLDPRSGFIDHIDIGSLDPSHQEAWDKVDLDLRRIEAHLSMKSNAWGKRCSLVVDGLALTVVMEHFYQRFVSISQQVNSAICCRLTPLQKANIVRMFQKSTGHTALAVGDGVNDVSMLQEARVGIGIIGLEGVQAALESDYAVPCFKHLRQLCAIHGRYSLLRNSICIFTSYYKNITLANLQFIFAFHAGFSGMSLFDGWLLMFYNILLTALPPLLLGTVEKDFPESILLKHPKLYTALGQGHFFTYKRMLLWVVEAIVLTLVMFYTSLPIMRSIMASPRVFIAGPSSSIMIYFGLVMVVLGRFALCIYNWNLIQALGISISVVVSLVIVLIYSAFPFVLNSPTAYWSIYDLLGTAVFWGYLLLWIGLLVGALVSIYYYRRRFFPLYTDKLISEYNETHAKD